MKAQMSYKWIIISFIVVLSLAGFVGCGDDTATDTNQISAEATEESTEAQTEIDFDLINDQMHEDTDIGEGSADYSYVQDFYIGEKKGTIQITAVVDDATDPEKALDFADTLVRSVNTHAIMQDDSIEAAGVDTYGGVYDRYDALVGVSGVSTTNDKSAWFVNDAITGSKGPALSLQ